MSINIQTFNSNSPVVGPGQPDSLPHHSVSAWPSALSSKKYRRFICHVCQRSFLTKQHLTRHFNVHLNDSEKTTFACYYPDCQHSYYRKDTLLRHIKMSHNAFPDDLKIAHSSFPEDIKMVHNSFQKLE